MAPSSVWFREVGGVVSLSPTHWRGINGFSNEYDGWGGEAWKVSCHIFFESHNFFIEAGGIAIWATNFPVWWKENN